MKREQNNVLSLSWTGKEEMMNTIITDTDMYLKYNKEKSYKDEFTDNLIICGNNIEALKVLYKNYKGTISLIYIDPPYNTGKTFVYNDNFTQKSIKGSSNPNKLFLKHSLWLNMMYPRLYFAKELLKEDGVIFISIDENEYAYLKVICDEIFGMENFIENEIWIKNATKNNVKTISNNHEYILIYAKNVNEVEKKSHFFKERKEGIDTVFELRDTFISKNTSNASNLHKVLEKELKQLYKGEPYSKLKNYCKVEPQTFRIFGTGDLSKPGGNGYTYDVIHPLTNKPCKQPSRGWFINNEQMKKLISENRVYFGKDEFTVPLYKKYLDEMEFNIFKSYIINNRDGIRDLQNIFGKEYVFDNPKPVSLLKTILQICSDKDSLVMDFFAGTGTLGHAVIEQNIEDNGSRKYILVQSPEEIKGNKKEVLNNKFGLFTIFDITQYRVKTIIDRNNINEGFKVYTIEKE